MDQFRIESSQTSGGRGMLIYRREDGVSVGFGPLGLYLVSTVGKKATLGLIDDSDG